MLKIIFEFLGGPHDGKALQGILGDASDAERYYLFTNHGAVGQQFKAASDYAVETLAQELHGENRRNFQQHYYVVTDRLAEDDEVLVRAEYVEPEPEPGPRVLVREHLESATAEAPSHLAQIERFLQRTARSLAETYSHYWPVEQEGANANRHLALHLAHVLLNEKFSVFLGASHPDTTNGEIDLLGIAPSQDWFLACEFQTGSVPDPPELLRDVRRLESFWLSARLTIEACGPHINRLATYCHAGYGLLVGGYWRAEDDVEPAWSNAWRGRDRGDESLQELTSLHAQWYEPLAVQHFEGRVTYHLLGASFQIPHRS